MSARRSPREVYMATADADVAEVAPASAPLVVSLRPAGDHGPMRRAAAAHGWRVVALSPWRIAVDDRDDTRAALRDALAADIVIATSPAAVRAAAALQPLRPQRGQRFCAVGSATAAALRRAGVDAPLSPARMDSEGLLALPALAQVDGRRTGLLTAPGGRDLIGPALRARGAMVVRADVYRREARPLPAAALARLRAARAPLLLPVSSGEALQRALAAAPADVVERLRAARVLAASARLAALAREAGCRDVLVAAGPRPAQLLAAAAASLRGSTWLPST